MKKNSKLLIGILIGVILTASVGVAASALYSSSEIGFTPTNTSWNVNNLQDAINDLYSNTFGGNCVSGVVTTNPTICSNEGYTIDLGFRATYFYDFFPITNIGEVWDSRIDNQFRGVGKSFSNDKDLYLTISDTAITIHNYSTTVQNTTMYYVACK